MSQLARKLGHTDLKLFGRDRLPLFMLGFAVYIAVALRYLLPWANDYLANNGILPNPLISQSLADFYPVLVAYMALYTGALLIGTVVGFVMLDEKDHHTLTAMLATPVPLKDYLLYRAGLPAAMAFVVVLAMVYTIGQSLLPFWQLLLISAGAALLAPIVTLFYAVTAANKVQGFAYGKFTGISGWIVMFAWFVPEPLQWLFGLFPPYWIIKAYWLALEGSAWWLAALALGIVLQLALTLWLMRKFEQVTFKR